ncbi:hypothetical protein [Candidatus Tisiphia endosymbiont of Hybos culiciformis]|uniref:hypothetical protein n=1 Tax=Candidatus Tisiphia endosymbiont of Hybos culiciformis TaxID=3139331 RepID=UPI003CCB0BD6
MFKSQEDNATSTSEEITEEQHKKKYEEFLASLESSRAKLEGKSVEEIKELSLLELAKYFCDDYLLIIKQQKQSQILSDPTIYHEEPKHNAYIYLDKHTKPDMDKFTSAFDALRIKILNLSEADKIASGTFTILEAIKNNMTSLQSTAPVFCHDKISDLKSPIGDTLSNIVIRYWELLKSPYNRTTLEKIINSQDGTYLTEEQQSTVDVSYETFTMETVSYNISEQSQTLDSNIQVPTTGSSNLGDDDLA